MRKRGAGQVLSTRLKSGCRGTARAYRFLIFMIRERRLAPARSGKAPSAQTRLLSGRIAYNRPTESPKPGYLGVTQVILHTIQADPASTNSSDDVYAAIKQAICQTRFAPGEYLREEQIARSLGVSRTPVREALRRLSAEGWLEVRPNHGARVKVWSPRDVEEIFEARVLIEPYLTGRAATRISTAETGALAALAEDMREIAERPPTPETTDAWFVANRSFHEIISVASGNARLAQSLKSMKEVPLIKWTFDNFDVMARTRSVRHHFEIVQAIEHRDVAWAEAVMKCHILAAQKSVLEKLNQAPRPD